MTHTHSMNIPAVLVPGGHAPVARVALQSAAAEEWHRGWHCVGPHRTGARREGAGAGEGSGRSAGDRALGALGEEISWPFVGRMRGMQGWVKTYKCHGQF